jgi:hypothetical protein
MFGVNVEQKVLRKCNEIKVKLCWEWKYIIQVLYIPNLLLTGDTVEMELLRWWVWEVLIHWYQRVTYT